MSTTLFSSMRNELEKLALTRWQQEMAAGNLGPQEMSRLPQAAGLSQAPIIGPAFTNKARGEMWGPGTDLNPEQLARHRDLNQRIGKVQLGSLGGVEKNIKRVGPGMRMGQIHVGPNAGQFARRLQEGLIGGTEVAATALTGRPFLSNAQPVDASLYRGVVAHEGGEKALAQGKIPLRPLGGHFGGMPLVEEQLATYRDPEAQKVFHNVRQLNPDDAFMSKKIRQFGGSPNSPLSIGGKGHVALEKAIGEYTPISPQSQITRVMAAAEGGKGLNMVKNQPIRNKILNKALDWGGRISKAMGGDATGLIADMRASYGSGAVDPHNMGAILKGLPSLVRR